MCLVCERKNRTNEIIWVVNHTYKRQWNTKQYDLQVLTCVCYTRLFVNFYCGRCYSICPRESESNGNRQREFFFHIFSHVCFRKCSFIQWKRSIRKRKKNSNWIVARWSLTIIAWKRNVCLYLLSTWSSKYIVRSFLNENCLT